MHSFTIQKILHRIFTRISNFGPTRNYNQNIQNPWKSSRYSNIQQKINFFTIKSVLGLSKVQEAIHQWRPHSITINYFSPTRNWSKLVIVFSILPLFWGDDYLHSNWFFRFLYVPMTYGNEVKMYICMFSESKVIWNVEIRSRIEGTVATLLLNFTAGARSPGGGLCRSSSLHYLAIWVSQTHSDVD